MWEQANLSCIHVQFTSCFLWLAKLLSLRKFPLILAWKPPRELQTRNDKRTVWSLFFLLYILRSVWQLDNWIILECVNSLWHTFTNYPLFASEMMLPAKISRLPLLKDLRAAPIAVTFQAVTKSFLARKYAGHMF